MVNVWQKYGSLGGKKKSNPGWMGGSRKICTQGEGCTCQPTVELAVGDLENIFFAISEQPSP